MEPRPLGLAAAVLIVTLVLAGSVPANGQGEPKPPCEWTTVGNVVPRATYQANATFSPGPNARSATLHLEIYDQALSIATSAWDVLKLSGREETVPIQTDPVAAPVGAISYRARLQVIGAGACDTTLILGPAIRQTKAPPPVTPAPAPEPSETPTETVTPTPTPSPTPTPTPTPEETFVPGQLLANGGFERLEGDAPAGWRHSGLIGVTNQAYGGRWALTLSSGTRGAKWADRAAPVEGGQWYAASA